MKPVCKVEFKPGSKEELLPDFDPDFPYIATCYRMRSGDVVPWHWHAAVELFYMESGCLEYTTPSARHLFPAGSAGLVNTNIPHMTRGSQIPDSGTQLLHLFDPALISGSPGSRIEEQYVLPLTAAGTELIALDPAEPRHRPLLELIRDSFRLDTVTPGWELRLRSALSEIWLGLLELAAPQPDRRAVRTSEQIRLMLIYIHKHYGEKLTVAELASAACISERACFALFQNHLHATPMEYIKNHRLQMACTLLAQTREPVGDIAAACCLGSSSYFSQLFRRQMGCTPLEYRSRASETQ